MLHPVRHFDKLNDHSGVVEAEHADKLNDHTRVVVAEHAEATFALSF